MRYLTVLLALWFLPMVSQGQIRGGFKTGLNFSTFKGPLVSDQGVNESFESATGFHVGPVLSYPITQSFGIKAEILYNQAGGKYHFDGPGFNIFRAIDKSKILAIGQKTVDLNILNTYLEVPILGYVRVGSFQLEAGLRFGFLLTSTADGRMIFSGKTEVGTVIEEFEQKLNFNYKKDEAGQANLDDAKDLILDGKEVRLPGSLGAYFYEDERTKLYNTLDFGLNIGASYYIGRSLYIGARANFGLSDVTNNNSDFSHLKTEGLDLIRQTDKDKSFQVQLTIGFSL